MYKCVDKTVIPLEKNLFVFPFLLKKRSCVLLLYVWAVGEVWSAQLIYVAFGFFSNFFFTTSPLQVWVNNSLAQNKILLPIDQIVDIYL